MLWLFILTVLLPIEMSHSGSISPNLTEITWCHAVNSQKELNDALKSQWNLLETRVIRLKSQLI